MWGLRQHNDIGLAHLKADQPQFETPSNRPLSFRYRFKFVYRDRQISSRVFNEALRTYSKNTGS